MATSINELVGAVEDNYPSTPDSALATTGAPTGLHRRRSPQSLFAVLDIAVLTLTVAAAALSGSSGIDLALLAASLPLWLGLARLSGLYHHAAGALWRPTVDELPHLLTWIFGCLGAWWLLAALFGRSSGLEPQSVLTTTLFAFAGASFGRILLTMTWLRATAPERALLIGDNGLAALAERRLALLPQIHVKIAGRVNDRQAKTLLVSPETLNGYDRVIFASDHLDDSFFAALARLCALRGLSLNSIPSSTTRYSAAAILSHVGELPVVSYAPLRLPGTTLAIKRLADIAGASLLLLLTSPLWAVCALAVQIFGESGPILYRQRRVGREGKVFTLLKFRTMQVGAEALFLQLAGEAAGLDQLVTKFADDPRVTRGGRWLRRTSLDELPQLWNILSGDMSLVGPRPETEELAALYSDAERFRLTVKPGLTGPMQVFGRAKLSWQERQALEHDYINHLSIWRDLRILALTPTAVIRGIGAS